MWVLILNFLQNLKEYVFRLVLSIQFDVSHPHLRYLWHPPSLWMQTKTLWRWFYHPYPSPFLLHDKKWTCTQLVVVYSFIYWKIEPHWMNIIQQKWRRTKSLDPDLIISLLPWWWFINSCDNFGFAHIAIFVLVKKEIRIDDGIECGFQLWQANPWFLG